MEQANRQIDSYLIQFKQGVKSKITDLQFQEKEKICDLLEYVWEYPKFQFQKEDVTMFVKKQEKKTLDINSTKQGGTISSATALTPEEQCIANRSSDGVQCTRKKKKGSQYCGTHAKIENRVKQHSPETTSTVSNKMEVSAEDIHGIIYYIDTFNNVYHTEDILEGKENPRIIAKAVRHPNNTFTIPELFLQDSTSKI